MVVVVREQFCGAAWSNGDSEVSTQKTMMMMATLQCTEEEECTELTLEFCQCCCCCYCYGVSMKNDHVFVPRCTLSSYHCRGEMISS